MAWVRYESSFIKHPKLQRIPEGIRAGAIAIHMAAAGYCADLLTDGLVPVAAIPGLAREVGIRRPRPCVAALVEVGLFIDTGPVGKLKRHGVTEQQVSANSVDSRHETAESTRDSRHETGTFVSPIAVERRHILSTFGVAIDIKERSYLIHDYLEYNPSRHAVTEERKRAAERQKRRRDREKQGVLDLDVTPEPHTVTSQRESRRESRDTSRARAPARPFPSPESVSSLRGGTAVRGPAAQQAAPTPSPNGTTAYHRARAFVERVGHEYPSWPVLADEISSSRDHAGRAHYPGLTPQDLHDLQQLHAELLDPEPS